MRLPLTRLGLVCDRHPRPAGVRRAAGRLHSAAARPAGGHELFHSRRVWSSAIRWSLAQGGSPLLWQHLFWFFGHPEVYIAILPGMGVASHVLSTFSRKPVFGYKAMVDRYCAIGFLGFCVWGHHMFISGMSPYSAFAFSILTMAIGVPSAIKTFNWLGTLWGGKIQFNCRCCLRSGSFRCSSPAAFPACSWRSRRWTSTCTTPISSSRTST